MNTTNDFSEKVHKTHSFLFRHATKLTWDTEEHNRARVEHYEINAQTTSISIPNVNVKYVNKEGEICGYSADSVSVSLQQNDHLCETFEQLSESKEGFSIRLSARCQGEEYAHTYRIDRLKYLGNPYDRRTAYLLDDTDETRSTELGFVSEMACQYLNVFIYIILVNNIFLKEPVQEKAIALTSRKTGFFGGISERIQKENEAYENLSKEIDDYIKRTNATISNLNEYLNHSFAENTKKSGIRLLGRFDGLDHSFTKDLKENRFNFFEMVKNIPLDMIVPKARFFEKREELEHFIRSLDDRISLHNDFIARKQIEQARKVIGNVEGHRLDDQQMQCIIKPMHNHLVIAGAGTGKTTTIVGKVKYLLRTGKCNVQDILVVSFTNASAAEMKERLQKETGKMIEASTFHKLGLNILTEVGGVKPRITSINPKTYVREWLKANIQNSAYLELLCNFILFNYKFEKNETDFETIDDYEEYLEENPPLTLKGEKVKSYGEMDIANFLFRNGIEYEYEKAYEIDTRTAEYAQYHPDFYLKEYGIYIEYFAIDENGNVPKFFTSKSGRSAKEEYQAGIAWKRKIHAKNETTLVECFAYERMKGQLLENLESQLKSKGVQFQPLSSDELWERIEENNNSNHLLNGVVELIATVIALIKSNDYTFGEVRNLCQGNACTLSSMFLLDLIEPIFNAYQNELKTKNEIDFDDMINQAAQMVKEGKYQNPYRYVIVDEYQDISKSRFRLLNALRKPMDYDLFCVGDDWQSIYRFAGSDLSYALNFTKHWGQSERSKIETTYRFNESLIDVSSDFVMKNPRQIRKRLRSSQYKENGFAMAEIHAFTEEYAIKFMLERLNELPENSSVFFIGRYNVDHELLGKWGGMRCSYEKADGIIKVFWPQRRDLNMRFLTAHKSKGLQADYVFIINNKNKGLGFPSKIQDDPLVDLLLEEKEEYPYAEERRLFYVAMTRARIKTFLVVAENNKSNFVSEIEEEYGDELKREAFSCPICGGRLVRRSGRYGDFWACSNYAKTGCKFTRKINGKQVKTEDY